MRALLAGWFSFEGMGATAGDLIVRDLVARWLTEGGVPHEVANTPRFGPGVSWRDVDTSRYTDVVFVCGPFGNGPPLTEFLDRFAEQRLVGLDVSMLQDLGEWDPFDLLLERDSSRAARPDLTLLAAVDPVPLAGLVLVHPQSEYGDRGRHAGADAMLRSLGSDAGLAMLPIDTRLDAEGNELASPEQVLAAIKAMDVVLTTRLHGMVLALHAGVPPIVLDPIAGGAKVTRQAEVLRWPYHYAIHDDVRDLRAGLEACLTEAGRRMATETADRARSLIGDVPGQLLAFLRNN